MTDLDQPSNSGLVLRLAAGALLFLASFFIVRPLAQVLGMQGPQQSLLWLIPALAAVAFFRFDRSIERKRGTASPNIVLFQNRYLLCILAHVVLLILAGFTTQMHWTSGMPLAIVSMLPALPLLALNYVFARNLVEETDEYQRVEKTQASLFATGLLLTVAMAWGTLEQQGFTRHVSPSFAFYIWWFGLGAAKVAQKFRA